jgi:hypothetical protein
LNRPRRNRLTDEAIALFRRLDAVPEPERDATWEKESRRLSQLLGPMGDGEDYESAWFLGQISVLDRRLDRHPGHGYWGGEPLARVREMRERLLEATKLH